jgi:hypothetical protein
MRLSWQPLLPPLSANTNNCVASGDAACPSSRHHAAMASTAKRGVPAEAPT